MTILEIRQYQTAAGRSPFAEWLHRLRDGQARARIAARLDRLQAGLCGGDKRTQQRDIEAAHGYWQDYTERAGKRPVPRKRSSP
jgi:putative component of toxin-antitoxin plasmid stabilization module